MIRDACTLLYHKKQVCFKRFSDPLPPVLLQINSARAIKPHPFRFQAGALGVIALRWPHADFPARVHHAVPGDVIVARAHRPANRTRGPRCTERTSNLPIRDDAPARNFPNERIDAREESVGRARKCPLTFIPESPFIRNEGGPLREGTRMDAGSALHINLRAAILRSRPTATVFQSKADSAFVHIRFLIFGLRF